MAERRVTHTQKDSDGDITALCYPGEAWSPRNKEDAIEDIDSDLFTYYVRTASGRSDIQVVDDPDGKYLRTDLDGAADNNLDELPDC